MSTNLFSSIYLSLWITGFCALNLSAQEPIFSHSYFKTEQLGIGKAASWQSLHLQHTVLLAQSGQEALLYTGHDSKRKSFHLTQLVADSLSISATSYPLIYKRKNRIHPRAEISSMCIKDGLIYGLCYDKLLVWTPAGKLKNAIAIDSRWSFIEPLSTEDLLMVAYYQEVDDKPNAPVNEVGIINTKGEIIRRRAFTNTDPAMLVWDLVSTHTTTGNFVLRADMCNATVWLLDEQLSTLDSLQMNIPYWKMRTTDEVKRMRDPIGSIQATFDSLYCKVFSLKMIADRLLIASYSCGRACNGQVILEITADLKLKQVGHKTMDGWGFWQDNKWVPEDYRYKTEDFEWLNQQNRSCIINGTQFAIHPGFKESMVGQTRNDYLRLLQTPVMEEAVYFYISKSKFIGLE